MDKNQIIGLVVMLVFITVYFQFFAPEPPVAEELESSAPTQVVSENNDTPSETISLSDSARQKMNEMKYGLFSAASEGSDKITTIENDVLSISFSSHGGLVNQVILKEYKDFKGQPLVLLKDDQTKQAITVNHLSRKINLSELYFTSKMNKGKDSTILTYSLSLGDGKKVDYIYTIPQSGYEISMKIEQNGLNNLIDGNVAFDWEQKMNRVEEDFKDSRNRTTVKYHIVGEGVEELSARSDDKEEETAEGKTDWVSFRQKFFTSAIISSVPFEKTYVSSVVDHNDSSSVKKGTMSLELSGATFLGNGTELTFYYGPNNYSILKTVADDFGKNVELGWSFLSWINKFAVIPIFHFLEKYISNYGIIIILMVFILKLVLSPLTYSSHMGMAKMRVLKPELDEIKEKNGDDAQKAQQEQMALYQKVGINPLSGCIPMLLQMPILFAMFNFFPNSIELRQESFLWAHDLSTYDSIISWSAEIPLISSIFGNHISLFTLLMTASTILYTWSNSQMTTSVQGPMKTMQYVMPVVFLFVLNNYAAGLTFYYFVSNIVSFGQIALFRKLIDEDKIKKALEENRKKNASKKKSSFQQRIEEAMKAKEQQQKGKK